MFVIGAHLSASKGYKKMGEIALDIGANTFQFFTRNPRGGKAKDINEKDIQELKLLMKKNNFGKILAHAPYTMNVCSEKENIREFSIEMMKDDLNRMEYLPGNLYNFHPGSHVRQGIDKGIQLIIDALNKTITKNQSTTVLLETMAGKGSEVGSNFIELKRIIDGVELNEKLGVCLDTCHVNDAGYNLKQELDEVLAEFDRIIGLEKLYAIHLNDSLNPIGSHKDRHAKIGEGTIGFQNLVDIINHPKLRDLPFFLETPQEDVLGYKKEIELLKKYYKNEN